MEYLVLVVVAVVAVGALAWLLAHYLPRFAGYLLGPASLLACTIVFFTVGQEFVFFKGGRDAWGPAQGLVMIAAWIVFGLWFVVSGVLIVKGAMRSRQLRTAAEQDSPRQPAIRIGRDLSSISIGKLFVFVVVVELAVVLALVLW